MPRSRQVSGFWSYLTSAIFIPWWQSLSAGILVFLVTWSTWIRDNLGDAEAQRRYATLRVIPKWPWQGWVAIALTFAFVSLIKNSYQLWKEQRSHVRELEGNLSELVLHQTARLLPDTAPEVEILSDRDAALGLPDSLIIRNASRSENIHLVCFQPFRFPDNRGAFNWKPDVISLVPPDGKVEIRPQQLADFRTGRVIDLQKVSELVVLVAGLDPYQRTCDIAKLSFTCDDRKQHRYFVESAISWDRAQNRLVIGPIDRKVISNS